MVYFWSSWLADALRADPWLAPRVIEHPGWQTRGRPPSEFSYLPSGIVEHHTACLMRLGHDPQSDIDVVTNGRADLPGPISQLLGTWTPPGVKWNGANPDPRIVVIAAGRSNHAGAGEYPWGAPAGNGSSIGFEFCGPSQVSLWPSVVIEMRERVTAAILKHNGWGVDKVTTHHEYARPRGRKVDPSGPWGGQPGIAWNAPWDANVWRQRVAWRMNQDQGENMQPFDPNVRVFDSRNDGPRLNAGEVRRIPVTFVPTRAVQVNLTATDSAGPGYLSAWGKGSIPPATSNVNFAMGETVANSAIVATDETGTAIHVRASVACHVIIDVQAFWA